MLPLPHWRRELDGQLARTNTPHRLWRLRLVAACAAEELHGPRGEHAPRASPSRRASWSAPSQGARDGARLGGILDEKSDVLDLKKSSTKNTVPRFSEFSEHTIRRSHSGFNAEFRLAPGVDIRPMQRFDNAFAPVCHGHGRLPRP